MTYSLVTRIVYYKKITKPVFNKFEILFDIKNYYCYNDFVLYYIR